ncbi:hypothetical protein HMPREF0080_00637 [Anaeroglobus geminatus F0357]|uniref:Uncharacterized protein n=1 Tax=Anaeroglobus geminatus F0357 TaxID=861450 RepID=G9YG73_9FIRM|nr:hypothetical protein HMPREF0080_00637 [Anaeroglobus geminatus F0357]
MPFPGFHKKLSKYSQKIFTNTKSHVLSAFKIKRKNLALCPSGKMQIK